MTEFFSNAVKLEPVEFPSFTGTRVLMMPVVLGNLDSIPESLDHYKPMLEKLFSVQPHDGEIGYLTIDEKHVAAGSTHRRRGLHMDGFQPDSMVASGVWGGGSGVWGGGRIKDRPDPKPARRVILPDEKPRTNPPSGPSSAAAFDSPYGTGMMLVSSPAGCNAWRQWFSGTPGDQGECEHMRDQCLETCRISLEPGVAYWLDPYCVHESVEQLVDIDRQLLRLSLPSACGWFEGCTPNPLGILPAGPILPFRAPFMSENPALY